MLKQETEHQGYPLPNANNLLLDDVKNIGQSFQAIDRDIHRLESHGTENAAAIIDNMNRHLQDSFKLNQKADADLVYSKAQANKQFLAKFSMAADAHKLEGMKAAEFTKRTELDALLEQMTQALQESQTTIETI
jgi:hypothetical protein